MTDTDRLVVWLREAMDGAQADAEAAGGDDWRRQDHPSDTVAVYDSKGEPVAYDEGSPTEEQQAHIVRHSPAAVLRRIDRDRKILAAHPHTTRAVNPVDGLQSAGFGCETCHDWDGVPEGRGWCDTVRLLAEGYGWTEETT